jgi:hypothetical protein
VWVWEGSCRSWDDDDNSKRGVEVFAQCILVEKISSAVKKAFCRSRRDMSALPLPLIA